MKTKHILTAMVLPAMFAACTAEEIVENNNVATNANRTQVESVAFVANGEAESRLVWDEEAGKFAWEDTDKFLLFPADDATTVNESTSTATVYPGGRFKVGKTLVTGYEYEKSEDGTYTTKAAQMGEGLWWGYAPAFEKKARGLVGYEISTSQDADYYKSEAAQAFITPLYEISSLNYNNKLPLEMINWYSTVVIPLTNSTKDDITLNQIVIELQGENDYFQTKGLINIEDMADFIMAYDGERWDDYLNLNEDEDDDRKAGKLIEAMRKSYLTTTDKNSETSKAIMLNLNGDVLEAGETKEYRILVPATKDKVSFNIIVLAEEGYKEITANSQSNYMKNTYIYHNGEKAAFGWKSGEAKAYDIKALNENGKNRYYVASKGDLLDLIYEVNGTFTAVKVGTWNIDAEIAEAIEESDSYVIFEGNYTISEEVASRTTEEDKGIVLSKVAFMDEVTVLEDTKVTFGESAIETNELMDEAKLIIEEGAEVVVEEGTFKGGIENEGTLTINKGAKVLMKGADDAETGNVDESFAAAVKTSGILNLVENNDANVTLLGGTLNYKVAKADATWATDNENLTISLEANAEVTVAAGVTLTNKIDGENAWRKTKTVDSKIVTEYSVAVTNNGKLDVAKNLYLYGKLTNEGKIESGDAVVTLFIKGTSENKVNAEIEVYQVVNQGAMTNNGLWKNMNSTYGNQNHGTITTGVNSRTEISGAYYDAHNPENKVGRINNTAKGIVVDATAVGEAHKQVVYYEFASSTVAELEALEYEVYGINTLRITTSLTMARAFDPGKCADATGLAALTTLELGNGAEVFIMKPTQVSFTKVVLDGAATIGGINSTQSTLTFAKAATVQMKQKSVADTAAAAAKKGYVLNVENIAVNGTITFNAPTAVESATGYTSYNPEINFENGKINSDSTDKVINNTTGAVVYSVDAN